MFQPHFVNSSAIDPKVKSNAPARSPSVSSVTSCKKIQTKEFEQEQTELTKDVPTTLCQFFRNRSEGEKQCPSAKPLRFLRYLL
jgi:hypothetical protein